jgi:hypothetical protein
VVARFSFPDNAKNRQQRNYEIIFNNLLRQSTSPASSNKKITKKTIQPEANQGEFQLKTQRGASEGAEKKGKARV